MVGVGSNAPGGGFVRNDPTFVALRVDNRFGECGFESRSVGQLCEGGVGKEVGSITQSRQGSCQIPGVLVSDEVEVVSTRGDDEGVVPHGGGTCGL